MRLKLGKDVRRKALQLFLLISESREDGLDSEEVKEIVTCTKELLALLGVNHAS